MRRFWLVVMLITGCGSDFAPPAQPNDKLTLDLAVATANPSGDAGCLNTACGGCSSWTNWDGTLSKPGDPCAWKGTWACNGTTLACADLTCPTCAAKMSGSVCGADGHTVLDVTYLGATCSVYDFGTALAVCNRTDGDHCVGRCTSGTGGVACEAHCVSDDGGGTGCAHMATDTCVSLQSC
jgi:hypothetical protein